MGELLFTSNGTCWKDLRPFKDIHINDIIYVSEYELMETHSFYEDETFNIDEVYFRKNILKQNIGTTKKELLEYCDNNHNFAEWVLDMIDWQHPTSLINELEDDILNDLLNL